jgi:hypothetical protein
MDGEVMKKISLILVITICFFGLGSAVYASPINQKASEFLDYCISMMKSEEDPCELTKEVKEKPVPISKGITTSTPHCMTENTQK